MSDPDVIVVQTPDNTVLIDETTNEVVVSSSGVQGIPGPPGPPGFYFALDFTSANPVVVTHNLGFRPGVTVLLADEEVDADVIHSSANQLTVTFAGPRTGSVVCS